MINRIFLLMLIIFLILNKINAQKIEFLTTINAEVVLFASDNIGNFFIVDQNGEISKYDKKFNKQQTFKSGLNGAISSISASIPLEVFVFYKDINRFVILDNNLTEKTSVNFENLGLTQVSLACPSYDKSIWVYDSFDLHLKKIDNELKIIHKSGNLTALVGFEINPISIIESDDKLYLNDPDYGILVFDIYGNYYNTIPLKGIIKFDLKSDRLYFTEGNALKIYNLKTQTNEDLKIDNGFETITNFNRGNECIYITSKKEVKIYLVKNTTD